MATAAEPPAKRSRRANFSDEEMMAMILGWQDRQDVLRERFSQNITAKRKKQAWEEVTTEVNSVSRVLRGREEVKKKFADFKSVVKKKMSNIRQEHEKTGRTVPPNFVSIFAVLSAGVCDVRGWAGAEVVGHTPAQLRTGLRDEHSST
ncbi:hypothetical protein Pcinc_014751 [Petrolisthes cinctipes]|uniref:Regulatory protein zeste n=1 Tax=Petrolisthes cinctipes TaxID=88211 RepID=A0AAE1FUS1_PETCI|nr:hypothetical protein Pcinc_014751 [Petrolisthes cinctipes]